MALRILYALAGLVAAYGAAHGVIVLNIVLDIGIALLGVALIAGWQREHSFVAAWPALLFFCSLFAVSGAPTLSMPVCTEPWTVPCVASESARVITVGAFLGVFVAVAWALLDLARMRGRAQSTQPSSQVQSRRRNG